MKKQSILFLCLALSTILSAQVSKTVNCTSGALSTLLSDDEKSTVTDLTITGTIDAQDFIFMRYNMPKLANIDMGAATIAAYQNNLANQIPAGAFNSCYRLTSVTIPNYVTSIGDYAYRSCSGLTGITIPNSVTSIGDYAFSYCYGLTSSLTIPNSVKSIGDYAFEHCFKFDFTGSITDNITIGNSVTTIGNHAFDDCSIKSIIVDSNNPNYSSDDGMMYNKDKSILIKCPEGKSGSLTIPNSVTSIGNGAFAGCYGLITIPSSVTSIGDSAFYECGNMTSFKVEAQTPVDLTKSTDVFYSTDKLTCTLYVPKGSKSAYQSADQWKDFYFIVEYDPNGITDITANGTSLYITDGQLHIKNAPVGEQVRVTSILGMLVYNGVSTTDELTVSLPQHGVYVVTVGSKSQSVTY
jgi:BspA type Leucine rich repeat region (6 copies)/Domain of unknown function (DUF6383)